MPDANQFLGPIGVQIGLIYFGPIGPAIFGSFPPGGPSSGSSNSPPVPRRLLTPAAARTEPVAQGLPHEVSFYH